MTFRLPSATHSIALLTLLPLLLAFIGAVPAEAKPRKSSSGMNWVAGQRTDVDALSLSANGKWVLYSENASWRLKKNTSRKSIKVPLDHSDAAVLSGNGRFVAGFEERLVKKTRFGSIVERRVVRWDRKKRTKRSIPAPGMRRGIYPGDVVDISDNGKVIVYATGEDGQYSVRSWNVKTGIDSELWSGGNPDLPNLAISGNGATVVYAVDVTGAYDCAIVRWKAGTASRLKKIDSCTVNPRVSHDGSVIVWGGDINPVTVWREQRGVIRTFPKDTGTQVDVSGNGRWVASFDVWFIDKKPWYRGKLKFYRVDKNRIRSKKVKCAPHHPSWIALTHNAKKVVFPACRSSRDRIHAYQRFR